MTSSFDSKFEAAMREWIRHHPELWDGTISFIIGLKRSVNDRTKEKVLEFEVDEGFNRKWKMIDMTSFKMDWYNKDLRLPVRIANAFLRAQLLPAKAIMMKYAQLIKIQTLGESGIRQFSRVRKDWANEQLALLKGEKNEQLDT